MISGIPPYDEAAYFASPVETTYAASTSVQQIARGDPMRTLIVITATQLVPMGTVRVQVSTRPDVSIATGINVGNPLVINTGDWGILTQQPWYAIFSAGAGMILTVLTLSLTRWPDPNAPPSIIQEVDSGIYRPLFARGANRPRRAKLYGNSWAKQQTFSPYDLPDWY